MNKKILIIVLLFLCSIGLSYALPSVEWFYGTATVGGTNAIAGSTICAGDDCISVSPAGQFGGADMSSDKLSVSCSSGNTVTFTISGTGCTSVGTDSTTCDPNEIKSIALAFSGTCGAAAAAAAAGAGGGGGVSAGLAGPSIGKTTSLDSSADFAAGNAVTVSMTQGDKATLSIEGTEYSIKLSTLTDKYVVLEYAGQYLTLQPGESKSLDINGDGQADVGVTLRGIEGGKAILIFKKLAGAEKKAPEEKEEVKAQPEEEIKEVIKKAPWKGIILTIAIVALGLIGYYVYLHRKQY